MRLGQGGGVPTTEFVEILSDTFASTPEGGIEDCITAMGEHPTMDDYWDDKAVDLANKNENPCKWRECAVCRGFCYAVCAKVIMDIVYRLW